jgi:hypothetical protein
MFVISLFTASALAQQASNPPFDFDLHGVEPPDRPNDDHRSWPKEDRILKKGLLAPTENDRNSFSDFLRDRHTGLIRLMPRESYDWEGVSCYEANIDPWRRRLLFICESHTRLWLRQ